MAWYNAPGVQPHPAGSVARTGDPRADRRRVLAAGLMALSLGACDFPTEPPIFESRFIIPAEATSLRIDELLPASVAVANGSFSLVLPDTLFTRSLAQLCGAPCALIPAGTPLAPKPPFTADLAFTLRFPADVQSATLASGRVRVELSQSFGFDALANGGYIRTVLTNGGRTVATDSVSGAFPSGSTLTRDLVLQPGTLSGDLVGTITVHSPLQPGPVTYDPNAAFTVRVRPGVPAAVLVSEASVRRPADPVSVTDVVLDLTDIDETMAERAESGTVVLEITNPFAAGGTMTLAVRNGSQLIATRQLALEPCTQAAPCTTTQRITPVFTTAEIRAMLGRSVTLSVDGALNTGAEFITVRPSQEIALDTQLDLVLRIGGDQ